MGSQKKAFRGEFNLETVRLMVDGENSVVGIARDMEIHPKTLYRWFKEFSQKLEEAFPGKGHQAGADPSAQAREERLLMEWGIFNDQLKSQASLI